MPVGIANASFTLTFSLTTGIIKNLLSITKNKKRKNMRFEILVLAKSKLDSIETFVSQEFIDMVISRKELNEIIR